ncbi:unnamed protein product [Eretmochelys imbricata]
MLWYRLNTLVPAPGFLTNLRTLILEFFWSGMHWAPVGVLHLPLKEGGQGLKCLYTQVRVFRLQTLQRLLYSAGSLMWSISLPTWLPRAPIRPAALLFLSERFSARPLRAAGLLPGPPPDLETVFNDQVSDGHCGSRSPRGAPATQPPAPCAGGRVPVGAPEFGPSGSHESRRPPGL